MIHRSIDWSTDREPDLSTSHNSVAFEKIALVCVRGKRVFRFGKWIHTFFFLSPYFFISLQCDLWSRAKCQEISCFWEEYHSHTSNLLTLSQLNWQSSFPFGIHVLESNELPPKKIFVLCSILMPFPVSWLRLSSRQCSTLTLAFLLSSRQDFIGMSARKSAEVNLATASWLGLQ